MKIGPAIRKLRKEKGLILEDLAHAVDTDATNISRVEREQQNPSFELLVNIAATLGVKVSELCALAEDETAVAQKLDPVLQAVIIKFHKLTPHHQAIVGEVVTSLLKLQKRQE